MRKSLKVYGVIWFVYSVFLCVAVYVVTAQTGQSSQPRLSVDNRGLKAEVEMLKGKVEALETLIGAYQVAIDALVVKQAVLVTGQVFDYRLGHEQLNAQIIEAGLESEAWMIWVCAPNEPTGEKQITRDQFITNAGLVNDQRQAQIAALLSDN
jgi:hypothetical protein